MKKLLASSAVLSFSFLLLFSVTVSGADVVYAVADIPAELLENANSVVRHYNEKVVIDNPSSYSVTTEVVITVLNENGKGKDVITMDYDSHCKVNFDSGAIYDAQGKEIRKIRSRDIFDTSNFQDFSLYEDNRIMVYVPRVATYPYTVKYSYTTSYSRGMYYRQSFLPLAGFDSSTENASLTIDYPGSMDIKFRLNEIAGYEPVHKTSGSGTRTILSWSFTKLKPLSFEYRMPGFIYSAPGIYYTADKITYNTFSGNTRSWQEFGMWIADIINGLDILPQTRIDQLAEMVKGIESDREKVKKVYEFLQSRTRYVNISLGIGGMQPFDAQTVDRTGYGDCKALSNYMKAMLKAIGITSYYTLVKSGEGENEIMEDITVNQFNHVILCVPLQTDTVWLECTNQNYPFGHLGDHIDNRPVLLIKEDGGHLVRTGSYAPEQNVRNILAVIDIEATGHGKAKINIRRGGIFADTFLGVMRLSPDDQKKWFYSSLSYPNYSLNSFSIHKSEADVPIANAEIDISLRSIGTISGQRMSVPLSAFFSGRQVPPRVRNRLFPLEIKKSLITCDTLIVNVPKGFKLENSIPEQVMETEFGKYSVKLEADETKVIFVRRLEEFPGVFPADKYQEYFRFFQNISRSDSQNIVFSRL